MDEPLRKHTPLFACQNLRIETKAHGKVLVREANLELLPREHIGVMGDSGSGKTTLMRYLSGNQHEIRHTAGQINTTRPFFFTLFQDADLHFSPYQSLYYYLNNAFLLRNKKLVANPLKRFWTRNFREHIDYRLLAEIMGSLQLNQRLDYDADDVAGFRQFLKNTTKNGLSGGQQQKFILLLALIVAPDVLIADEIFTDMDQASVQDAIGQIFSVQNSFQVVLVSHKIDLMHQLVDTGKLHRIYLIRDGATHPETWTKYHRPDWAENMLAAHREIEEMIRSRTKPEELNDSRPLIEIKDLRVSLGGKKIVDAPDGFRFFRGRNYALEGENGVGKTTVFKTLLKLYPYRGLIAYQRLDLSKIPRFRHVCRNQLVFQKTGNAIEGNRPLGEYLLSFFTDGVRVHKAVLLEELVHKFFKSKRDEILDRCFSTLSVGEQRRVLLIRAILFLKPGGVVFIDEAVRGMDIFLKRDLIQYIREKGFQVFLITHDSQLRAALCDEVVHMKKNNATGFKTVFEREVLS